MSYDKEWFEIPYMRLCRMDLEAYYEEESYKPFTDEQMQRIANIMSNMFMEDWENFLKEATKRVMEENKNE